MSLESCCSLLPPTPYTPPYLGGGATGQPPADFFNIPIDARFSDFWCTECTHIWLPAALGQPFFQGYVLWFNSLETRLGRGRRKTQDCPEGLHIWLFVLKTYTFPTLLNLFRTIISMFLKRIDHVSYFPEKINPSGMTSLNFQQLTIHCLLFPQPQRTCILDSPFSSWPCSMSHRLSFRLWNSSSGYKNGQVFPILKKQDKM